MDQKLKSIRDKIAKEIKTSKLCHPWFYKEHFLVVEKFAKELCDLYPKASRKAVMLAAWFHDASRAHGRHKKHDVYGAHYAKKFLTEKGFDKRLIKLVCEACRLHRCKKNKPKSIEAKILATSDAMSHFSGGFYLRIFNNFCEEIGYEKAREKLARKIERDFKEKLFFKEAKQAVKPYYKAWQQILKGINL